MSAVYREIEFNIFSAQDLRNVRILGGKMSPYVVAWIHPDLKAYSPADVKGGPNPKWNADIVVFCDEALLDRPHDAVVNLELHDAGGSSNRLIGSVSFPLSDLPGNIFMNHKEHSDPVFLNLPVRRPSGREQGVLNFSMRLGGVSQKSLPPEARYEVGQQPLNNEGMDNGLGCCGIPTHFYKEQYDVHLQDGRNVIAH
ncbi:protein SRC2 homolog [Physcomitrium patens]|uniref:C2 domain-containing protein n=1 Tax=Physcomitrium patens TaxID=3218 RepID=A0A2K1JHG7_PHYPA|nr:uncharacterized protein LOC112291452 [Physcomitrium patens]PNR41003.1 hypothetical protein PHYPA_018406 [Physcomitrium patens]|eukprot:XP_024394628.1 uncharacterized protein LOC112291452 [Physcomitrella patens]